MKIKAPLFLILITFVTLQLAACGGGKKPSLEERLSGAEDSQESYEGLLTPVDSFQFYENGTHQLETLREGVILLQSRTIDLNRYINEQVRVEGEMEKGVGKTKSVLSVKKISYLEDKNEAGQKAYENKTFGFRFEHPAQWLLKELSDGIELKFQENAVLQIRVFSDQGNLVSFANSKEEVDGVEVTVAAQKALRYISGSKIVLYVANPPKQKIYRFEYANEFTGESTEEKSQRQKQFYALLKSFEMIYISQIQGQACGGEPTLDCPENFVCELNDGSEFAEGICVPIGSSVQPDSCPYVSPPNDCDEYRIADYSANGCPSLYQCIETEAVLGDSLPLDSQDELEADQDSMEEDSVEDDLEESSYTVPGVGKITQVYTNEKLGIEIKLPSTWYYASFGSVDGTLGKIGFADEAFEELDEAIITLSVLKQDGGKASKKLDDLYYVFDGPDDLTEVMDAMAAQLKLIQ